MFTNNSEDDFTLVTLKMENDADTDYCLVETQSVNSSAAATALEDAATAAGFSAEASTAFYVSLIDSAYDVASAAKKSGSIQPDLKGLVADIGLNIAMNITNLAAYTSTSDPSRTKTNRFDADIGIEFDVNSPVFVSDLNSYPAQNGSNGYGANIGVAMGLNYTLSTTDLPSETAQSHAKGFGADFNINFGLNTVAFAPGQHKKRRFGADFGIKFGFSTTVSTPTISSTPAQLKTRRVGANLALKFGFTAFKEYFKFKNSAANNYSTTDYSGKTRSAIRMSC